MTDRFGINAMRVAEWNYKNGKPDLARAFLKACAEWMVNKIEEGLKS